MCFTVQLSKIGFALPFVSNSFAIISCCFLPVKNFFSTFLKLFLFLSCSNFGSISCLPLSCQELFSFLFDSFLISARSLRRNSDRIPPLPAFVTDKLTREGMETLYVIEVEKVESELDLFYSSTAYSFLHKSLSVCLKRDKLLTRIYQLNSLYIFCYS